MQITDNVGISSPDNLIETGISREKALDLYYYMRLTREVEQRAINLYRQGRLLGALYTAIGNEAVSVGTACTLQDGDVAAPLHRGMGVQLVRGTTPKEVYGTYMGRGGTGANGKDGSLHIGSTERGMFSLISHLGSMMPPSVGVALASKISGENYVAITYIGDGATSIGEFHESLNFAAVMRLPFILVIENNQFAYSTPLSLQFSCKHLVDRAKGYGMAGERVDGTDVIAVYQVCREAVDRARAGEGPTLIEAVTMRLRGHSEADRAEYVPKAMLEAWSKKDPVEQFERRLHEAGWLSSEAKQEMEQDIAQEIHAAVEEAERSPNPAAVETLTDVYAN